MYKPLSHRKLVQACTLYKSLSHKGAGTNMYIVQFSPSQGAGTNMYKSQSYKEPVQICTYSTNLSLTGSWFKFVQISLSQDPVPICTNLSLTGSGYNRYKSLSHKEPAPICTTLSLSEIEIVCTCPAPGWSIHIHRNIPVDG